MDPQTPSSCGTRPPWAHRSCWALTCVPGRRSIPTSLVPGHGLMEANSQLTQHDQRPSNGPNAPDQHVHGSKPLTEDRKGSDVQTQMQAF